MKTLVLCGILDHAGSCELHIPFTTDVPPRPRWGAAGSEFAEVELLDRSNAVLNRAEIDVERMFGASDGPEHDPWQVIGLAAMPDETEGVRLRWRGNVIYESWAPAGSPAVRCTWTPPEDGVLSGAFRFTWNASHPDDVPLHFFVFTQNGDGRGEAVASLQAKPGEPAGANQVTLDSRNFSRGTTALVIRVSDGFHEASDTSEPFTLAPH